MENSGPKFDDNALDEGYEQDDSCMAEEQSISSNEQNIGNDKRAAKQSLNPIARKRRGVKNQSSYRMNHFTDSGYEQDGSSDMAVVGNITKGKLDREEETQVLPFSGSYVDHSLDPDDDRPFAPIHRKPNFPESLFAILSNTDHSSIIEWLPHGRSFVILNRDEFAKRVLPVYFRHSNLTSFNRQLNGYGFDEIKIGPNKKSYFHPFFLRNLPHLVKNIKRYDRKKSPVQQRILTESQLARVSVDRPLPKKMSPTYAKHIDEINQVNYVVHEWFETQELRKQPQAPVVSAVPAFATQDEAIVHPIPSIIYTPSPNPLPPVNDTLPPQYEPQISPSFDSTRRSQTLGIPNLSACQHGTVYTQLHPPLAGVAPNLASQNVCLPYQTQPFLPFHQQVKVQAGRGTVPQIPARTGRHFAAQASAFPRNALVHGQAQLK